MWKSFENVGLQTSEKVSWEKKFFKHAQNIGSTVHGTNDLMIKRANEANMVGNGCSSLTLFHIFELDLDFCFG